MRPRRCYDHFSMTRTNAQSTENPVDPTTWLFRPTITVWRPQSLFALENYPLIRPVIMPGEAERKTECGR